MLSQHTQLKTPQSKSDYINLIGTINSLQFTDLAAFTEALFQAEPRASQLICLRKGLNHFAKLCDKVPQFENYNFVLTSSTPLCNLIELVDDRYHEGKTEFDVKPEAIETMTNDKISILNRIIQACIALSRMDDPAIDKQNTLALTSKIIELLMFVCFDDNGKLRNDLRLSLEAIHLCLNRLISYTTENLSQYINSTQTAECVLTETKNQFIDLTKLLSKNGLSDAKADMTFRLCTVLTRSMSRRLVSASPRAIALFKPEPKTIREDKHLSQVVANYYDFDDTIYDKSSGKIPESIIEKLEVLHDTLGIKAHIITARNHEMDHKPHHFMDRNNNANKITFVESVGAKSIPGVIKSHGLNKIIAPSNIIYCDFYHKVVTNHDEYPYYYDYCDETRKTSKVTDFIDSVNAHRYDSPKTAIYDDNITVWTDIEKHTKNFFHINNKSTEGNLASRLNNQILQLILYGTHLDLTSRVWAANTVVADQYFKPGTTAFSALERFIAENSKKCTEEASLDISF